MEHRGPVLQDDARPAVRPGGQPLLHDARQPGHRTSTAFGIRFSPPGRSASRASRQRCRSKTTATSSSRSETSSEPRAVAARAQGGDSARCERRGLLTCRRAPAPSHPQGRLRDRQGGAAARLEAAGRRRRGGGPDARRQVAARAARGPGGVGARGRDARVGGDAPHIAAGARRGGRDQFRCDDRPARGSRLPGLDRDPRFHGVTVVVECTVDEPVRPPSNPLEISEVAFFSTSALPRSLAMGMREMLDAGDPPGRARSWE